MMKKINKTVIGAFVVGALAILITAILVFGGGQIFRQADKYVLFLTVQSKGFPWERR